MSLFDGLGSEGTVTNTGGSVQATLTLSAFGQALASTGSSGDPYQYAATSRYRSDGDAGLALVGARYYDAQVGQFITRDTYLDQKSYAYCDGDPVNGIDPSGHDPLKPIPYPEGWPTKIVIEESIDGGWKEFFHIDMKTNFDVDVKKNWGLLSPGKQHQLFGKGWHAYKTFETVQNA